MLTYFEVIKSSKLFCYFEVNEWLCGIYMTTKLRTSILGVFRGSNTRFNLLLNIELVLLFEVGGFDL